MGEKVPPPRIERGLQVPETCVISFSPRGHTTRMPPLYQKAAGRSTRGRHNTGSMRDETCLLAPAKINLYLRILGRRTDGYHLLDSLMVPISLFDEIVVRARRRSSARDAEIRVTSDSETAPGGPRNLAHRAAALFLTHASRTAAVDIHIRKHIPVGSGLGGGSSDAAAVLLALNWLLGRPFDTAELARLGSQLGADVPFFVYGSPAHVRGIGEQVLPVTLPALRSLVVCWDHYSLATKLVYASAALSLTSSAVVSNIPHFVSGGKPGPELLVNDLERPAAQIHPEVLALKSRLIEEGAIGALMTGSGAAVFGMWPDTESASGAALRLRQSGLWAESVEVLAVSPAATEWWAVAKR
jgi:4-diphosphocytidyl-2-C-methyl-D-erythritol kinase